MTTSRDSAPPADWGDADPLARSLVPEWYARQQCVYPLSFDERRVIVATADPDNLRVEQALAFAAGRDIEFRLSTREEIESAWSSDDSGDDADASSPPPGAQSANTDANAPSAAGDGAGDDEADESAAGQLFALIERAVAMGASDLHLEPREGRGVVRVRVDGVMREVGDVPSSLFIKMISRLKVQAGLDIAEHRRPQDGRAVHERVGQSRVAMRVSVVPSRHGEKVVARLLRAQKAPALTELGLISREADACQRLLSRRDGVIVVTGPTGSGKSTTLYSLLGELDAAQLNVCAVEDPIEYALAGATQVQVNRASGVTFASALRAFLRQDPDVILLGEVRDAETTEVALQAATTGHLVLTTLHTNDALGTLPRLLDLGASGAVLADALRGIVAQRLVRRLCAHCARDAAAEPEQRDAQRALQLRYGVTAPRVAVGCAECGETGYRGRTVVAEVIEVSGALATALRDGAELDALRAIARRDGMRGMIDVARDLVASGVTTLEEIHRVLGDADLEVRDAPVPDAAPVSRTHVIAPPVDVPAPALPPLARKSGVIHPSVLIADQDVEDLLAYEAHLASRGWRVTTAIDGEEARRYLTEQAFNLAVLRLRLPKISGRELLQRLRSHGRAAVPVVLLTNVTLDPGAERTIGEGAADFLHKPVSPHGLERRCLAVMTRRGVDG